MEFAIPSIRIECSPELMTPTKEIGTVGGYEASDSFDIHGNRAALSSVLDAEADADEILCLGDLVDYGPEPAACVGWAMQAHVKSIFIQGNHDWGVALKRDPSALLWPLQILQASCSSPNRRNSLDRQTQIRCYQVTATISLEIAE
jgi:Calcineurin-like phosphoesterase superfamily domain